MTDDESHFLNLGRVQFHRVTKRLVDPDGSPVALSPQSVSVLSTLADRAGEIVAKDDLANQVWGPEGTTDEDLVQCIAELRRAIGDDTQNIVRTVPTVGYQLMAPITETGPAQRVSVLKLIALAVAVLPIIFLLGSMLISAYG